MAAPGSRRAETASGTRSIWRACKARNTSRLCSFLRRAQYWIPVGTLDSGPRSARESLGHASTRRPGGGPGSTVSPHELAIADNALQLFDRFETAGLSVPALPAKLSRWAEGPRDDDR
jgi:hypothetical protein